MNQPRDGHRIGTRADLRPAAPVRLSHQVLRYPYLYTPSEITDTQILTI